MEWSGMPDEKVPLLRRHEGVIPTVIIRNGVWGREEPGRGPEMGMSLAAGRRNEGVVPGPTVGVPVLGREVKAVTVGQSGVRLKHQRKVPRQRRDVM